MATEHIDTDRPLKRKPRPASLDLKSSTHDPNNSSNNSSSNTPNDMSQFAIQCLSPGLPPLDPQMQSTILISKSIEQQQRQLIKSRQTPTGLTAQLEPLSIPSPSKRLKRNAPPPLNLQQQHFITRPMIMSAPSHHYHPYQQFYTPKTSRQPTYQRRVNQKHPSTTTSSSFTPMTPYGLRTAVPKSAIYQTLPRSGAQRSGIIPKTAGGNIRYRGLKMKRDEGVVDVFHKGERMAPLAAQPLSAQREFFDHGEINIRAQSKPKDIISKTDLKREVLQEDNESSDVENNAIEPEAEHIQLNKEPVIGEIRILNNSFRFEFKRNDEETDRERFLKRCETAWDEFVKLGN